MPKASLSRETLLPKLATHVLNHGLGGASLRPLAKAAGTSDRMLIYHFGNKEQLVTDILEHIANIYATALDAAMGVDRPKTRRECLERIVEQGSHPIMQPFMTLWWEIVAGSARGLPGYREAADAMMARQLLWLENQMPENDPDPAEGARYLMTLLEGTMMLAAIGRDDIAEAAIVELES